MAVSKKTALFREYVRILKEKQSLVTLDDLTKVGYTWSMIQAYYGSLTQLEQSVFKKYPKLAEAYNQENHKKELVEEYIKLRKKFGRILTATDLVGSSKVSWSKVQANFGSIAALEAEARAIAPQDFPDIELATVISKANLTKLRSTVKKSNRFFITTAVTGCVVDDKFLKSIKNYCNETDAELLILVCSDPAHKTAKKGGYGNIDRTLLDEHIIIENTALNNNIHLSTAKMSAKQIDPTTGLDRFGQRNSTMILASPKQRLKGVGTGNISLPHFNMSTGAITVPNYVTEMYMSERTAFIANHDHVMGGIIVEIVDDEMYHFRQVQADRNGHFIDLGTMWTQNDFKVINPAAFVLGDWHSGVTDPQARAAWQEVCKLLHPDLLVLHDAFDGLSINHWEEKNGVLRAIRAMDGTTDLGKELVGLTKDLRDLSTWAKSVALVKSNHDEFLNQYITQGKYIHDPLNRYVSVQLDKAMMDKKDPLRFAVEELNGFSNNNLLWLSRRDELKVAGIHLGAHGDKGSNGKKNPGLQNLENSYVNCVTGHSHAPEILRGAWRVGTSSLLQLEYNEGPSSWLHTSCLVYPNGSRQLISCINGQWRKK